mmetsp:Transcript_105215/g.328016  ORF Transcript_105215/g.328016 Transcript_105215/m.328016 type:complete len:403 (-) Transcript_105215:529-1737(-)
MREAMSSSSSRVILYRFRKSSSSSSSLISCPNALAEATRSKIWAWSARQVLDGSDAFSGEAVAERPPAPSPLAPSPPAGACAELEFEASSAPAPPPSTLLPGLPSRPLSSSSSLAGTSEAGVASPRAWLLLLLGVGAASDCGLALPGVYTAAREGPREGVAVVVVVPVPPSSSVRSTSPWRKLTLRLRFFASASCARDLMSLSAKGIRSKSSSSLSSSKRSAFCVADKPLACALFCADSDGSSGFRVTAEGRSCGFTNCGFPTTCLCSLLGASCLTNAEAVGGKAVSTLSVCGTASRNLPSAFSTQSSHSGKVSSRRSGGSLGKSSIGAAPCAFFMSSISRCIRCEICMMEGAMPLMIWRCSLQDSRSSADTFEVACNCFFKSASACSRCCSLSSSLLRRAA